MDSYQLGRNTAEKQKLPDMKKMKVALTYDEKRIILMSLIELKNQLIREGRYTDVVDELLIKFID